jgi:hypothetical protein
MRNKATWIVALLLIVAAAVPALAHHSFAAQYDRAKPKTLTGPVTKLDWINPHARIFMDVTENGKTTNWEVELGPPAMLMRSGWSKSALPVGSKITVNGSLAKDGSNLLNAMTVTLADGKRVFAGSSGDSQQQTGTPAPETK